MMPSATGFVDCGKGRGAWLVLNDAPLRRGLVIRVGLGDCPDRVGEAIDMMDRDPLSPAIPTDVVSQLGRSVGAPAPAGDVS